MKPHIILTNLISFIKILVQTYEIRRKLQMDSYAVPAENVLEEYVTSFQ